jgi:hypothetical protein
MLIFLAVNPNKKAIPSKHTAGVNITGQTKHAFFIAVTKLPATGRSIFLIRQQAG